MNQEFIRKSGKKNVSKVFHWLTGLFYLVASGMPLFCVVMMLAAGYEVPEANSLRTVVPFRNIFEGSVFAVICFLGGCIVCFSWVRVRRILGRCIVQRCCISPSAFIRRLSCLLGCLLLFSIFVGAYFSAALDERVFCRSSRGEQDFFEAAYWSVAAFLLFFTFETGRALLEFKTRDWPQCHGCGREKLGGRSLFWLWGAAAVGLIVLNSIVGTHVVNFYGALFLHDRMEKFFTVHGYQSHSVRGPFGIAGWHRQVEDMDSYFFRCSDSGLGVEHALVNRSWPSYGFDQVTTGCASRVRCRELGWPVLVTNEINLTIGDCSICTYYEVTNGANQQLVGFKVAVAGNTFTNGANTCWSSSYQPLMPTPSP